MKAKNRFLVHCDLREDDAVGLCDEGVNNVPHLPQKIIVC